jgi:hypothetical protein
METLRIHDRAQQCLISLYALHELATPDLRQIRAPGQLNCESYNRNPCVWQVCTIPSRLSAPTLCFIRYK